MLSFAWEPIDFLDALEVTPTVEEDETFYHYVVERNPLNLELKVWPLNCDVELRIHVKGVVDPIVHLNLLDCPGARLVDDKRGKFIEFAASNLLTGRYDITTPAPYGFRLHVYPNFKVTTFAY